MKKLLAAALVAGAVSMPTAASAHPIRVDYIVTVLGCGGYLIVNADTGHVEHRTNCLG